MPDAGSPRPDDQPDGSADTAPSRPEPAGPAPVEPAAAEPAPVEPTAADAAPVEPAAVDAAPAEPAAVPPAVDPLAADPSSADPLPAAPSAAEPPAQAPAQPDAEPGAHPPSADAPVDVVAPPSGPPAAEPGPVDPTPPPATDHPAATSGERAGSTPISSPADDVPADDVPPVPMAAAPLGLDPVALGAPVAVPAAVAPVAADPDSGPGTDSTAGDPDSEDAARGGRGVGRRALAVLAVLALLAVVGTGYLAWQVRQGSLTEAARTDALAAARDAARLLFSYDHESLEDDFEAGTAVTTGEFREEYERTTREVVSPVATEYDASVEAEVVESGVVSAEPDRVVVVVYINQTTTSTRVEGPKIDQSRVRMVLTEVDGEWLVEQVDAL